ncbi:DEFB126 isoform 1 [Pan troglodytes]|uniref:Defensin beta 126 n=2 Tax=Pan troglodytes TaxID=9598 RepID=H2QJS2_PANTR|nr:beta-defensin 126 preproprotein [Pan troglodytes]AAY59808.1 beta-defensin 126 [Pan troglodytes troglodytes]PNI62237.1 DEFB126 isoform 1 [Pan troglodytes]
MKSLLFTLAVFMLLAQLVSGNWYVKKCLNDVGICKKKCKPGEMHIKNGWATCGKQRDCCVPADRRANYPAFCVQTKTTRTSTVTARTTLMVTTASMSSMAPTPVSPTG